MKWTLQTSNIRNTILNCHLFLGRKAMTNLDSIFKSRDIILLTKVRLVKTMVFPVVMYKCESWTMKKTEHWRIDAFELWCWRRLLRVPWTARRSNQSILKEINPWSWSSNPLATWCEEQTHWKRPWCWQRLRAGGEGDDRGWGGWMASDSGRWWRTGKPGVLQPMGLQRVGHHWETEQQLCFQQGCVPSLSASWIHGSRAGILPLLINGHPSQHPPPDGPISLLEELKLSIALARADFLTTFSPHVSWVSTL